jgi:hypothetical protein
MLSEEGFTVRRFLHYMKGPRVSDETSHVRITMREVYDLALKIDAKVSALTEARAFDAEMRDQMNRRIDDIETTLESLRARVLAWPSLAGAAAAVAIVIAIVPRFTA